MANKTQRAQKNAKKKKGEFKKSSHCMTEYQRDCKIAEQNRPRKHHVAVEG